jgi:hypothetical protein
VFLDRHVGLIPRIDDDYFSMTPYPWGIPLLGGALVSSTMPTLIGISREADQGTPL